MKRSTQKGFTLVELMTVVVIVGILVGLVLPAYHDYMIGAHVAEGLILASTARLDVIENVAS